MQFTYGLGGMVGYRDALPWMDQPPREHLVKLHRISNLRNALTIILVYAQTAFIVLLCSWVSNMLVYLPCLVLMGRAHMQFGKLSHDAVHRTLFSNRTVNDFAGRWITSYPTAIMFDRSRYYHLIHHANELGQKEPELPIYANYPISKTSMLRKLARDASGYMGIKNIYHFFVLSPRYRPEDKVYRKKILVVQVLILLVFTLTVGFQFYFLLWVLPWLTSRRVIERLHAISEHGGMMPSSDIRLTTHFIRQTPIAKFLLMPLNSGHHMAHHIDPQIPFRNLPKLSREMRRSGFIPDEIVHKNYTSLLRKLTTPSTVGYSEVRIPQ
jgi:fatty acid desaturase